MTAVQRKTMSEQGSKRPLYRFRRAVSDAKLQMQIIRRRMGGPRRSPSVFVIGVQKAGTTTLFGHLAQHSQILPPLVKEVHYFDVAADRGDGWYRAHFPTEAEAKAVEDATGRSTLTFDTTPYYIFQPEVTRRLLEYAPDAKVIAVLRDPVARAWSHYWHERARSFETLSPKDAFALETERVPLPHETPGRGAAERFAHQHFSYCARSEYDLQLERWRAYLPADRLLCLKSEALFTDPETQLRRVSDFLGIDAFKDARPRALNTGSYGDPPPDVQAMLRERLGPSMASTRAMLGPEFSWD